MFTADQDLLLTIKRVRESSSRIFSELVHLAGLDPKTDLVGMDLDGVDFSGSDLRGFNLAYCSLQEAKLEDCIWDETTIFPSVPGATLNGLLRSKASDRSNQEVSIVSGRVGLILDTMSFSRFLPATKAISALELPILNFLLADILVDQFDDREFVSVGIFSSRVTQTLRRHFLSDPPLESRMYPATSSAMEALQTIRTEVFLQEAPRRANLLASAVEFLVGRTAGSMFFIHSAQYFSFSQKGDEKHSSFDETLDPDTIYLNCDSRLGNVASVYGKRSAFEKLAKTLRANQSVALNEGGIYDRFDLDQLLDTDFGVKVIQQQRDDMIFIGSKIGLLKFQTIFGLRSHDTASELEDFLNEMIAMQKAYG